MPKVPLGVAAAILGACLAHAATTVVAAPQAGSQAVSLTPPMTASAFAEADLREWLTYIASDDLQGRQAYTEGLGLAGAFLARRLEEWGVAPAGDNNTYFQVVRVLGIRARSRSSVTVTVKGQSRTFKDGEGVTFPRNQGGKQVVSGPAEFVGHGVSFAPIGHNDFARRNVAGKVVLYTGSKGPPGFSTVHSRVVNARGRTALETFGAAAAIGPAAAPAATPVPNPNAQRVDFQSAQRLDTPVPPQITAGDDFFAFVLSASGQDYGQLKAKAERQERLPDVALQGVSISIAVDADYDVVQTRLTRNVVGIVRGADPTLAESYVMMGAHYDHVGYQQFVPPAVTGPDPLIASCPGQSRPTPRAGDIINNGADDDGSGTVVLLEIAEAMANGPRPARSIIFHSHAAEEKGLLGSAYWTENPTLPLDSIVSAHNMDMLGKGRVTDVKFGGPNTVQMLGSRRVSPMFGDLIDSLNAVRSEPMVIDYSWDRTNLLNRFCRSDQVSYVRKGIPTTYFSTGYSRDYHQPTDEPQYINYDQSARVARFVHDIALMVANRPDRLTVLPWAEQDPAARCGG
jgi:hypothetical protein